MKKLNSGPIKSCLVLIPVNLIGSGLDRFHCMRIESKETHVEQGTR